MWGKERAEDPERFEAWLNDPPRSRSVSQPSPATLAQEAESFVAFMAEFQANPIGR